MILILFRVYRYRVRVYRILTCKIRFGVLIMLEHDLGFGGIELFRASIYSIRIFDLLPYGFDS